MDSLPWTTGCPGPVRAEDSAGSCQPLALSGFRTPCSPSSAPLPLSHTFLFPSLIPPMCSCRPSCPDSRGRTECPSPPIPHLFALSLCNVLPFLHALGSVPVTQCCALLVLLSLLNTSVLAPGEQCWCCPQDSSAHLHNLVRVTWGEEGASQHHACLP